MSFAWKNLVSIVSWSRRPYGNDSNSYRPILQQSDPHRRAVRQIDDAVSERASVVDADNHTFPGFQLSYFGRGSKWPCSVGSRDPFRIELFPIRRFMTSEFETVKRSRALEFIARFDSRTA